MVTQEKISRFLQALNNVTKIFASIEYCQEDPNLTKYDLLALSIISSQKELIMSHLAKNLNVSMSTATGIIDKLVKKELVKRERNHGDRRIVKVVPTAQGETIAKSFQKQKAEIVKQVLEPLSTEEQESLISIIEKISKAGNRGKGE